MEDDMYFPNYDETQQHGQPQSLSSEHRKQRKSAAGRSLIRWDFEKDQHLLLCLEYEAAKLGLQLPWDEAVQHIKPGATGQAAIQHLAKVRKYRLEKGQEVPPEPTRRRPAKKNGEIASRKRAKTIDVDDDDDDYERPFNGSSNRMVFDPLKRKAPRGGAAPTTPNNNNTSTTAKAQRRRASKVKKEEMREDHIGSGMASQPGGDIDPITTQAQAKTKRDRSTRNAIQKEAIKLEAPILDTRSRNPKAVNYTEPDSFEDLEGADGHDDSAYDRHGAYNIGMGHADGEHEVDAKQMVSPSGPSHQNQPLMVQPFSHNASVDHSQGFDTPLKAARIHASSSGVVVQSPKTSSGNDVYSNDTLPFNSFNSNIAGTNHGLGMDWMAGRGRAAVHTNPSMSSNSSHGSSFRGLMTPRGSSDSSAGFQTPSDLMGHMSFVDHSVVGPPNPSSDIEVGHRAHNFGQLQYPSPVTNYTHHLGPQRMPNDAFGFYNDMSEEVGQRQPAVTRRSTLPDMSVLFAPQHHLSAQIAHSVSSPGLAIAQPCQSDYLPQAQPWTSPQQQGDRRQSSSLPNTAASQNNDTNTADHFQPQQQESQEQQSFQATGSTSFVTMTSPPILSYDGASPYEEADDACNDMVNSNHGGSAFGMAYGDDMADDQLCMTDFVNFFDPESVHRL